MTVNPLASVIIPTYNYAKYISEAVESILNSDFPHSELEVIIIDDGSTDDTSEVIKTFKDKVKYIYQKNAGKAQATKVGINNARGQYLFNLDADDLFLPNKISEVVDVFEKDKSVVHVAHPAICWDCNNDTKTVELIPDIAKANKVMGSSLLSFFYRKNLLFGGGSTFAGRTTNLRNIKIPKEVDMFIDEYLVLFILNQGYSSFIEHPLSIWRIHGRNFSVPALAKANRNMASMEAVLSNLLDNSFPEDVKQLYLLKLKVAKVAIKEDLGEKDFGDIIDLWAFLFRNFGVVNINTWEIAKKHSIFNRTIPATLLKHLKKMKRAHT